MDPLSAAAGVVSLVEVTLRTTSYLISYTQDTHRASADRKLLAEEVSCLSRLLERLRDRAKRTDQDLGWLENGDILVRQMQRAQDDLAKLLKLDTMTGQIKQESRLRAIRTATKWSFTKVEVYALLERITRLQQCVSTLLLNDQNLVIEQMDKMQQEARNAKQKSEVLSWLSPLHMTQIHQTISDRVGEGSGTWFLTSDKFVNWEANSQQKLWCFGIPGSGKTVLTSIVVNHLRRIRAETSDMTNIGIAVIYLRYDDPNQTLTNLVASLVKQLAQEHEIVPRPLQELYNHHSNYHTSPSLLEVSEVLRALIVTFSKTFFVIDALDECSEEIRWGLTKQLRESEKTVSILITSRFLDSFSEELEDFEPVEIKAHKSDIELFIDFQIRKNKNLSKVVQRCPRMREDIKQEVVRTAEDMFLIARLHIESLASAAALSIKHVRNKLKTLPMTLSGTYDEAMRRIEMQEPERKNVALKTLAWLSYAFRSLSLKQLQHALAIEPGDTDLDEELLMDGSNITALCAGLIVVDQRSSAVNLVHYTTKNYFEQVRDTYFPNFHATITMSCATYLTLSVLKDATIWRLLNDFPLASYAAAYMGDHARNCPEEALEISVLEMICQLLSHPVKRKPLLALLDSLDFIRSGFNSSSDAGHQCQDSETKDEPVSMAVDLLLDQTYEMSESDSQITVIASEDGEALLDPNIQASRIPEVTALHLAASMGLAKVASMLLRETTNIDAVDETGKTALAVAMERGFEKAVEFLINSGACVDLRHERGQAILIMVIEKDWTNVADIIVEKSKDAAAFEDEESRKVHSDVRLLHAAYHANDDEVRAILETASIELQSKESNVGPCALSIAVERKHTQTAQMLLIAGVDVNSKDGFGQTSLHRATRRQSADLIRLLLQHGADIDSKRDDGRTPWSAYVRTSHDSICRLLIEAGADPNTVGFDGVHELYEAAANGEVDYVKVLLKSGVNPSIKTRYNWTPLHWAANNGQVECVKLLIAAGAELSPVSDQDTTPLDMALRADQLVATDILARAGAKEGREMISTQHDSSVREMAVEGIKDRMASLRLSDPYSIAQLQPTKGIKPPPKLSLTFDKPLGETLVFGQFVYPSNFPQTVDYFYHISHPVNMFRNSISIRHTQRRADMSDYPLGAETFFPETTLYKVVRITSDYQELELRSGPRSQLPGTIKMQRGWTGSWTIHHDQSGPLFRTKADWSQMDEDGSCWVRGDGKLQARTRLERSVPTLTFEPGLDMATEDVLVACWIAKVWAEMVTKQKSEGSIAGSKSRDFKHDELPL